MRHGFNGRVPTLPALLRAAGYATQAVTSHLYVSAVYGLDEGFDRLDFHQDRRATDVADRAIDLLDRFGDRPFFLFLHFYDPHWHYDPPEAVRAPLREAVRRARSPASGGTSRRDAGRRSRRADLEHLLALYDGEIRYTDDELGRVLDHLAARGALRNTLVVVTSDHGEEFLEHGSWEHQKTLYEEVDPRPADRSSARHRGPRREPAQVSLLDVAPTILAWAGLAAPPTFQGRSLLAPLPAPSARRTARRTTPSTARTSSSCARARGAGRRSCRWTRRADRCAARSGTTSPPIRWRRRRSRPGAAAADAIRARALARWKAGRGPSAPAARAVCLTAEQKERLRALGYVHSSGDAACPAEAAR